MLSQTFLSLVSGIFIGASAGFLGTLMLEKRMALASGPLGHLTLPGIALALLYGFDVSLGAFPFVVLGIVLIWLFEIRTKLPMEALTAIVFSAGVAFAFFFLPIQQAEEALIGDITKIGFTEALASVVLSLAVFFLCQKIYQKLLVAGISEDLAKAEGINPKKYNFLYLLSLAVIISLGVRMVGGLLTAALTAIPAASARNFSRNLIQYKVFSPLFGAISFIIGFWIFKITGLPLGPLIISANAAIFLFSLLFKK